MVKIVITYWGNELKKIELDPNNEKEVKNAIDLAVNTIFTVLGSHDEINVNGSFVNSPEELVKILEREIERKKVVNIKIRPFMIKDEINIEDKGLLRVIELTYVPRF